MREQTAPERIHVVIGSPWRDAVIKHLEPSAPYRPWSDVSDVRAGDGVAVVFDTEPRQVLWRIGHVGADGDVDRAIAELDRGWLCNPAVALPALGVDTPAVLDGAAASDLLRALDDAFNPNSPEGRFGHAPTAQLRAMLESSGGCTGCGTTFDLTSENARHAMAVRTVDADADGSDWPAVLCLACELAMRDGGYPTFLDYRFARNPACPRCGGRRTRGMQYGMPISFDVPPWVALAGCCVSAERWCCEMCSHSW